MTPGPSTSAAAGAWTATTPPVTRSTMSASSTQKPETCTSATRRACTCRTPVTRGRARRRPPSARGPRPAPAALRKFAALQPTRLLFSHYGPVTPVGETLDRSAEEIIVWVEETRQARAGGLDLHHAVAMVRDRTIERYAAMRPDGDPAVREKFERVSSDVGNV